MTTPIIMGWMEIGLSSIFFKNISKFMLRLSHLTVGMNYCFITSINGDM